jgi:sugar lactone lactonase YvrE
VVAGVARASRHCLRVFISYRREDTSGYAGRIYDALAERFGEDAVFMDIDTIRPGSDFKEIIAEALGECDVLLALVGHRWLNRIDGTVRRLDNPDDLVRVELETALRRNITLIPLLVQNTKMPAREELPASLARVATKQAFEISDRRWRADITGLIDELENLDSQKARRIRLQKTGRDAHGVFNGYRLDWFRDALRDSLFTAKPYLLFSRPSSQRRHPSVFMALVSGFLLVVMLAGLGLYLLSRNTANLGPSMPPGSARPIRPPGVDARPVSQVQLKFPYGVGVDTAGRIYIADSGNLRVRRVDGRIISTIAGTGDGGNSGDGGPATKAKTTCHGVAIAADGTVFIAAIENNNVRKVDPTGVITTLAGNGSRGYSGDGGPATQAQLNGPWDVDVGRDGAIYIADTGNHRIRRVDISGRISTVAGNGTPGFAGDDGAAIQAQLTAPRDVAVGPDGALYIADGQNHRIRRVDISGRISTVAGNGTPGFAGDGGPAIQAELNTPHGVDVDTDGNIYIADLYNNRIRKVDRNGNITTVAGTGAYGFSGDDGQATNAQLAYPRAVAVYTDGTFYIADINNNRIRKVDSNGTITTIAGGGA